MKSLHHIIGHPKCIKWDYASTMYYYAQYSNKKFFDLYVELGISSHSKFFKLWMSLKRLAQFAFSLICLKHQNELIYMKSIATHNKMGGLIHKTWSLRLIIHFVLISNKYYKENLLITNDNDHIHIVNGDNKILVN